jgi:glycosyltransferase involved in cell wall biosynthesis
VRNQARFVKEAARSVLSQSLIDLELVAIDDASTDETPDVLERLRKSDSRVRVFRNPKRTGLTRSLNRAFALARGRFLARQDGDDISKEERLARQADYLARHSRVDMVGASFIHREKGRGRTFPVCLPETHGEIVETLEKGITAMTTVMFRRTLADSIGGYDERMKFAQDFEFYLRASRTHRLANIREPLSVVRFHENNISVRHALEQRAYVLWALWGAIDREPFAVFFNRWLRMRENEKRLRKSFMRGDYREALDIFSRRVNRCRRVSPASIYQAGSAAKKLEKTALAARLFQRVLEARPADPAFFGGACFHLGEMEFEAGRLKAAEGLLKTALERIPDHRRAKELLDASKNQRGAA